MALALGAAFASDDPRFEQGARFEAKGDYEMALGEYRAILAEQPKNSEAYFKAAEVYMKTKNYSRALANYRLAYKNTPTMSAAYEGAAKVYEALGQKAKAQEELAKDPKNAPVQETAAETAAAAPAVESAPAEAPVAAAPVASAPVASAPAEQKPAAEPEKAAEPAPVAKAEAAAPAAAPTPAAAPAPAESKSAAVPEKTASAPEKTAEPANLPTDPFEKGKALLAEGKYKEAAPLWREVLAKQPGHAGAYFYAGVTRFELGEYDKAEFNLKKGLGYKDGGDDANYYLAVIYQKTNRTDLEKKSLAAYLKKAGPDGKFRKEVEAMLAEMKSRADSSKQSGVSSDAAAVQPAAEVSAPAVAAKPAEPKKAEPTAASFTGTNSVANANLLFKAGSLDAALQMYKALLETELSMDERYFSMLQMGNIYREMRDFHSAVDRYREVVLQYPDSDWASQAERALDDALWLEKHASELPRVKR